MGDLYFCPTSVGMNQRLGENGGSPCADCKSVSTPKNPKFSGTRRVRTKSLTLEKERGKNSNTRPHNVSLVVFPFGKVPV